MAQRCNIEPDDDQQVDERGQCFCEICYPTLEDDGKPQEPVKDSKLAEA